MMEESKPICVWKHDPFSTPHMEPGMIPSTGWEDEYRIQCVGDARTVRHADPTPMKLCPYCGKILVIRPKDPT